MVDAVGVDDELVGGPPSDTATSTGAHRFTALGFDAVVTAPFEASARRWLAPSVWFFGRRRRQDVDAPSVARESGRGVTTRSRTGHDFKA